MGPRSPRYGPVQLLLWAVPALPLVWYTAALAEAARRSEDLGGLLDELAHLQAAPLSLHPAWEDLRLCLGVLVLYALAVYCILQERRTEHPGEEHGSARWGSAAALDRKYRNRADPAQNLLISAHVAMSTDSRTHRHNLNVAVIGGSGAGKTRGYVLPNAMQCACSYLLLDPKGELLRTLGGLFEREGIAVTVVDLVNFRGHYNPMAYLDTDEDAMRLAYALVHGTKPQGSTAAGGDKFWDDSAVLLISALLLYLMHEAPAEEQNLPTLMWLITNCRISENDPGPNPLQTLFAELENRSPDHPAVRQFNSFMLGAAKTLQSVLISAAASLYMFNTPAFAAMTLRDETFLPRLGLEKRAVFCILPDNDPTYNFLVTILYTQLFDQLFRLADSSPAYGGRLPVPVRLLMDEFANVALPKNFKNILAVCRSRGISCDIILQNIAQLKSLFKDDWEGILGNCDTLVYLGGNEYGTFEYLSKILGKETEQTRSRTMGKGERGSSSEGIQTAGRDLAAPDEIRRLSDSDCLVLMRSEDPVIDRKYDLLHHPNNRHTFTGGAPPYEPPGDHMAAAADLSSDLLARLLSREEAEEPDDYAF